MKPALILAVIAAASAAGYAAGIWWLIGWATTPHERRHP